MTTRAGEQLDDGFIKDTKHKSIASESSIGTNNHRKIYAWAYKT